MTRVRERFDERCRQRAGVGGELLELRHGLTQDFESHSHHVLMSVLNLFRSEDFKEGVQSFAEKRPPTFNGR